MAIKKSELYSSLWKSCDQLRGGMDASQYKDYVLVLLFVKYVSDKYAGQKDALIEVPVGSSFTDMVALKGDKEIGDKINKIISRLADANNLKGVIDVADFNDAEKLGKGKEMVDRLSELKDLQKLLDVKVAAQYAKLTEPEIKTLVVNDKWFATLATDVQTELDRVSQALTGRIKQLAERYATPLPKLTAEVITLETKVNEHLKKMGFVWQAPCAKVGGE